MTAAALSELDPADRHALAEDIVEYTVGTRPHQQDYNTGAALLMLTRHGLNPDREALHRACEAWAMRDEVLGCAAQVERYEDVNPVEGTHRAAQRFVDDRQEEIDADIDILAGERT